MMEQLFVGQPVSTCWYTGAVRTDQDMWLLLLDVDSICQSTSSKPLDPAEQSDQAMPLSDALSV